jgi:hypothetical protein
MAHHRAAAALVSVSLALIGLTACGNNSHQTSPTTVDGPTAPTTGQSTGSSTSTNGETTTTTVLGPSGSSAHYPAAQPTPPSLARAYPVGDTVNLITVIKTLTTYRDWVYSHPNPAYVSHYMFSSGNQYASEVQNLSTLRTKGWHEDPVPTEIQWAKVTLAPVATNYKIDGHVAFRGGAITIVQVLTTAPYLDSAGQVVGHEPGGGSVAYSITLAQVVSGQPNPDGQFRILDVQQLNPPGGISALESE